MTDIRREITFAELPDPVQQTVLQWIRSRLRSVPWTNRHVTTYGLLDSIDRDTGIAISTTQLNQALVQSGFRALQTDSVRDPAQLAWNWNISIRSPYFSIPRR